ncbi:MAG: hypothetical protein AVDCRST_MAG73-3992 [uncultured Thermomicrobiales bacterium]|uniref:Pyrrolo-quinoline quinone repeat domain-containing protein n=1 Tax=uncultured Thermomicrobiales bacterium TaxID=1645740 RepID=A0A6J4V3W6_9BACT|nr:MAG: hypothetical protein AVDCRST_MAG73-3992 [uncultured Thermomicrobiales bacterium]
MPNRRGARGGSGITVVLVLTLAMAAPFVAIPERAARAEPAAATDVLSLGAGPDRSGAMPGPGPTGQPALRWRAETGAYPLTGEDFTAVYPFFLNVEPAVAAGLVVAPGIDTGLVALDVRDGMRRWRSAPGRDSFASPTVADSAVYAGSYDGVFHAVDLATGAPRWTATLPGDPVTGSPAVADGRVTVGTIRGAVVAFDAHSGVERWRSEAPGFGPMGSPAIAGGVVYALRADGSLRALDAATGTERWRFDGFVPPRGNGLFDLMFTAFPVVADGLVFVGGAGSALHALDAATGREQWRLRLATLRLSAPAVSGGTVFVAADGAYVDGFDTLHALDAATGAVRWSVVADDLHTPPTVVGDIVYAGGGDLSVSAYDAATGERLWRVGLAPPGGRPGRMAVVNTAPVVTEGMVFVGADEQADGSSPHLGSSIVALGSGPAAPSGHDASASRAIATARDVPAPGACRVAPRTVADLIALGSKIDPLNRAAAPLLRPVPAAELQPVAREWIACVNADDYARLFALLTDGYLRRNFATGDPAAAADLAALMLPAAPLPESARFAFVGLADVLPLDAGRVRARVRFQNGDGVSRAQDWIFVPQGGRWRIDEVRPVE